MLPLTFASTPRAVLRGCRHLVVIAPASRWGKRKFPAKLLDKKLTAVCLQLAADTDAGARGDLGTTLVLPAAKGTARTLSVGVLPDQLSRHNSPARADSIRHVMAKVPLGKDGKIGVLLVLDDATHVLPAANAVARALPLFSRKGDASKARVELAAVLTDGTPVAPDPLVSHTVECSRQSAELVDTPPSELDPAAFAKRARELLKTKGVRIEEIRGDALTSRNLGGIHAVGRAARSEPRMVVATFNANAAGPHVALVGKGVTYDTGGLHLKARGMMEGMKADMGGAAAVLGAFRVLVAQPVAHPLTLILCLAENAVAADAYKPDDILQLHSGKTVEINNTDAEGRLLLADGVSYAARELAADVVIDAATLTGAQLISTGLVHAAVVSNDDDLERESIAAGRRSGDLVHPLPFAPELFQSEFASPVADMRNSVANRSNAQSSCAAQFVYAHLEGAPAAKSRRWLHIDLAGPAFHHDRASGFGVALIAEVVRSLPG